MSPLWADVAAPGKDYFKLNLLFLTLVGLRQPKWPKKWLIFYEAYSIIMHILPIIYLVISSIGTYNCRTELISFLSNLDKNLVALNYTTKYIVFAIRRKQIFMLISEIMHSGDKISKRSIKLMSTHVVVVTLLTISVITAFSLTAMINREKIVETWMPFDPLKNFNNYILAYQILLLTFMPSILRGNAMQGLVCSLVMYLCEQLKELQGRIRALKYSSKNVEQLKTQFKEIIRKHIRLMRYSETMKTALQEYFFIQNLAITIELCLNAVMIAVVGINEMKLLVSFLAYLCVALLNAYIYCYLGHELIIQSENIAQAAYDAEWTSWPVGLQKDLLIVIINAQKPLTLSAGGMANMSMETFAQALYNGYSIFAVLSDAVD